MRWWMQLRADRTNALPDFLQLQYEIRHYRLIPLHRSLFSSCLLPLASVLSTFPDFRHSCPCFRLPIADSRFPIPEFDNCLLLLIIIFFIIKNYHISKIWIIAVKTDLIWENIVIIA
ncbi:MAG: hypothetical protein F6K56_21385 [Moorea sp. SIO3G5]|nr:hypothetical protein [Moorena sp. SIO3G5]